MKRLLIGIGALLLAASAQAQTTTPPVAVNPCDQTASGPYVILAGKAFRANWCMPSKTVTPEGDTVDARVDGFTASIDTGASVDIGKPTSGTPSPTSGLQFYSLLLSTTVKAGAHTLVITPWNFKLNADGTPTTERQPGGALSIPFAGIDPYLVGPPPAPVKGSITK